MDTILNSLSQHAPQILLILLIAIVALSAVVWRQSRFLRASQEGWKELLTGSKGENLEKMLYDHMRDRLSLRERLEETVSRVERLESKMQTAKRYVGLVRYDAFEDVGGSQSFALAIYDEQGDGAIVTSLVGRTDCRVYCKTLVKGRSERSLSQEEQRAINEAASNAPRPIIS